LPPKQALQLVQWSFSSAYIAQAKLWGDVSRKCMAFCPSYNKTKNNLRQEKEVSDYN
jgi:hypothetical protein